MHLLLDDLLPNDYDHIYISKVFADLEVPHLPHINYAGERASVKVKDKADRKEIVLQLAKKQGYIIRKDVEAVLDISQASVILLLRDMVESGLLVKVKNGKQMKYRAADF